MKLKVLQVSFTLVYEDTGSEKDLTIESEVNAHLWELVENNRWPSPIMLCDKKFEEKDLITA